MVYSDHVDMNSLKNNEQHKYGQVSSLENTHENPLPT